MDQTEVAALLTYVGAFDNREPNRLQAKAWLDVLAPYALLDCQEAVREHFTERTECYLEVGHIIQRLRKVRVHPDSRPVLEAAPAAPNGVRRPPEFEQIVAQARAEAAGRYPKQPKDPRSFAAAVEDFARHDPTPVAAPASAQEPDL